VTTHARWDSIGLLLGVMSGVAGAAAILVQLPRAGRRTVVSAGILFHFGGILSAVITDGPSPRIAKQLSVRVCRPYLDFLYLWDSYHYFAPEPGPEQLLWFRVAYTDDDG
jgi:hypothetical protein